MTIRCSHMIDYRAKINRPTHPPRQHHVQPFLSTSLHRPQSYICNEPRHGSPTRSLLTGRPNNLIQHPESRPAPSAVPPLVCGPSNTPRHGSCIPHAAQTDNKTLFLAHTPRKDTAGEQTQKRQKKQRNHAQKTNPSPDDSQALLKPLFANAQADFHPFS